MNFLSGIKRTLDAYITANYDEVRAYTNHMLTRLRLHKKMELIMVKSDTIINNAYLHVATMPDHEADENKVKSYLLNTIKMQVWWPTSVSRKQDELYSQEFIPKAEAYFEHKRQTSREMAEYFDIPRTSAYYMIKAMKQKIKEIEYSYRNGKDQ